MLVSVLLLGPVLVSWASPAPRAGAQFLKSVPGRATLATFAGVWQGHTRTLTIARSGRAKESIYSGCCDFVIDLEFQLSRPAGTARNATATATVTAVHLHDRTAFTKAWRPPRLNEAAHLRLERGVITEPLTGTDYCDATAGARGTCGA